MKRLAEVVSTMLGRPAEVAQWNVSDVCYESGAPVTGSLQRAWPDCGRSGVVDVL